MSAPHAPRTRAALAVALLSLLLHGCGSGDDAPAPQPTPAPAETAQPAEKPADDGAAKAREEAMLRLEKQLAGVAKLAVDPRAYEQALERYDALRPQYTAIPEAVEKIDRARTTVAERAESAARKLLIALDAEVTRMLGEGRKGDAYDKMRAFPEHLLFTKVGRGVAIRMTEIDEELGIAFDRLMADVAREEGAGKHAEAIAMLNEGRPIFDEARRDKIAAALTRLNSSRGRALAKERKTLVDEHARLEPELKRLLQDRAYGKARAMLAPLVKRLDALTAAKPEGEGATDGLQPLRVARWDLDLLGALGGAFGAGDAKAASAADYLAQASTSQAHSPAPSYIEALDISIPVRRQMRD